MKDLIAVFNKDDVPTTERFPIKSGTKVIIFEVTQKELEKGIIRIGAVSVDGSGNAMLLPFNLLTILGTAPDNWTPDILNEIDLTL